VSGRYIPSHDVTVGLLRRGRDVVRQVLRTVAPEQSTHDAIALQLHARTVRVFEAVCILLTQNLPEEALFLGRSLFEDALRLEEIAESGDARAELLLGWANDSISEKIGLIRAAVVAGLEPDSTTMLANLERDRKQLSAYQRRNGVDRLRRFRQVRDAALRYDRAHGLWTYLLAHEAVHGSDAYFAFLRTKQSVDTITLDMRTTDSDVVFGAAAFCIRSAMQATKATAAVFGLQLAEDPDVLCREVMELELATAATNA